MDDQDPAHSVEDGDLDFWEKCAGAATPNVFVGDVNWPMMVRSRIAEMRRLREQVSNSLIACGGRGSAIQGLLRLVRRQSGQGPPEGRRIDGFQQTRRSDPRLLPIIQQVQASSVTSLSGIAAVLNARGVRTARSGRWAATQVGAVLRRAGVTTPIPGSCDAITDWPGLI